MNLQEARESMRAFYNSMTKEEAETIQREFEDLHNRKDYKNPKPQITIKNGLWFYKGYSMPLIYDGLRLNKFRVKLMEKSNDKSK